MTNKEAIKFLSQIMDAILVSNSWLPSTDNPIKESFGMAINALKAQEQLANNSPKLDSEIDRQSAIDAVKRFSLGETDVTRLAMRIEDYLGRLPSAQPEKRTEKRTKTHSCDCISRQAAIDAHYEYCNKHPDAGFPVWSLKILEDLPSAQPEIIRCKDCIFHGLCRISPKWAVAPKDDWYCADAERRTDGV